MIIKTRVLNVLQFLLRDQVSHWRGGKQRLRKKTGESIWNKVGRSHSVVKRKRWWEADKDRNRKESKDTSRRFWKELVFKLLEAQQTGLWNKTVGIKSHSHPVSALWPHFFLFELLLDRWLPVAYFISCNGNHLTVFIPWDFSTLVICSVKSFVLCLN